MFSVLKSYNTLQKPPSQRYKSPLLSLISFPALTTFTRNKTPFIISRTWSTASYRDYCTYCASSDSIASCAFHFQFAQCTINKGTVVYLLTAPQKTCTKGFDNLSARLPDSYVVVVLRRTGARYLHSIVTEYDHLSILPGRNL